MLLPSLFKKATILNGSYAWWGIEPEKAKSF